MGRTVAGHKTRTIYGEKYIQLHQADIMDDLVVGTLEKRRVNRNHGQKPLAGKARRKADGVFFRHADVKEAARMAVLEEVEACAVLHGSGDATDARLVIAQIR